MGKNSMITYSVHKTRRENTALWKTIRRDITALQADNGELELYLYEYKGVPPSGRVYIDCTGNYYRVQWVFEKLSVTRGEYWYPLCDGKVIVDFIKRLYKDMLTQLHRRKFYGKKF